MRWVICPRISVANYSLRAQVEVSRLTMPTATEPNHLRPGSERNFGLVFSGFFALMGCWPLIRGEAPKWIPLGIAAGFAIAAFATPSVLRPFNLIWFHFGLLLHRVMSPLVMGLVFFLCVTPIGWLTRCLGKDPMALRPDREAKSYWVIRDPPGLSPASLKKQF